MEQTIASHHDYLQKISKGVDGIMEMLQNNLPPAAAGTGQGYISPQLTSGGQAPSGSKLGGA
eukprot:6748679-Ditylum_brightwellii.AAC.1